MNDAEWDAEFVKYKAFPEFQRQNQDMTLGAFVRVCPGIRLYLCAE